MCGGQSRHDIFLGGGARQNQHHRICISIAFRTIVSTATDCPTRWRRKRARATSLPAMTIRTSSSRRPVVTSSTKISSKRVSSERIILIEWKTHILHTSIQYIYEHLLCGNESSIDFSITFRVRIYTRIHMYVIWSNDMLGYIIRTASEMQKPEGTRIFKKTHRGTRVPVYSTSETFFIYTYYYLFFFFKTIRFSCSIKRDPE